jgi:hypothetical protein
MLPFFQHFGTVSANEKRDVEDLFWHRIRHTVLVLYFRNPVTYFIYQDGYSGQTGTPKVPKVSQFTIGS